MRKAFCLVILGCALVVGLACSGDSSTPTAPATTSELLSTTAASADKIYICHGDKSEPTGVVVEVSDEAIQRRHFKHLDSGRDCICENESIPGEPCDVTDGDDDFCDDSCPSPAV